MQVCGEVGMTKRGEAVVLKNNASFLFASKQLILRLEIIDSTTPLRSGAHFFIETL